MKVREIFFWWQLQPIGALECAYRLSRKMNVPFTALAYEAKEYLTCKDSSPLPDFEPFWEDIAYDMRLGTRDLIIANKLRASLKMCAV
jgi:hypothetical protein